MNFRSAAATLVLAALVTFSLVWLDSKPRASSYQRKKSASTLLHVDTAPLSHELNQTETGKSSGLSPQSPLAPVALRSVERRPHIRPGNFDWRSVFRDAVAVATERTPADLNGRYTERRLVRAEFKYPLVRIEEDYVPGSTDTGDTRVATRAFIADHIVVQLRPGKTQADLDALLNGTGYSLRKALGPRGPYLVEVSGLNLNGAKEDLMQAGRAVIKTVEPDFIAVPDF